MHIMYEDIPSVTTHGSFCFEVKAAVDDDVRTSRLIAVYLAAAARIFRVAAVIWGMTLFGSGFMERSDACQDLVSAK